MKKTLTGAQLQALYGFAGSRGRNWKAALRQAWETGNYLSFEQSNDLQTIRNEFGPTWLVGFRFPKETATCSQCEPEDEPEDLDDRRAWEMETQHEDTPSLGDRGMYLGSYSS